MEILVPAMIPFVTGPTKQLVQYPRRPPISRVSLNARYVFNWFRPTKVLSGG